MPSEPPDINPSEHPSPGQHAPHAASRDAWRQRRRAPEARETLRHALLAQAGALVILALSTQWFPEVWDAAWFIGCAILTIAGLVLSFQATHDARLPLQKTGFALLGFGLGTTWSGLPFLTGAAGSDAGVAGLGLCVLAALCCVLGLRAWPHWGFGFAAGLGVPALMTLVGLTGDGTGSAAVWVVLLSAVALSCVTHAVNRIADEHFDLLLETHEQASVLVDLTRRVSAEDGTPRWRGLATAIAEVDEAGRIAYANPAMEALCEGEAPLLGRHVDDALTITVTGGDGGRLHLEKAIGQARAAGELRELSPELTLYRAAENRTLAIEVRIHGDVNGTPDAGGNVLLEIRDVTELHGLSRIAAYHESHDHLTGLPNRRTFTRALAELVTAEDDDLPATLCFIDLDHLDIINDSCGHAAGDAILRQVADRLAKQVRGTDTLARVGGDQFAVLLRGCPLEDGRRIADQLLDDVRDLRFEWGERRLEIRASIGIADTETVGEPHTQVFAAAHGACRTAQRSGGNVVVVHDPDSSAPSRAFELADWIETIRAAIREDRFKLLVQPIEALDAGADLPSRGELLVRIVDEAGQLLSPTEFISAAEHYDLMPDIDRWVIKAGIEAIGRSAPGLAGIERCAINLSGQSLGDETMLEFIESQLESTGIDPRRLSFEITETAVVENFDAGRAFIQALAKRGCHFSLDDFGTGSSSYLYLKHLPVDTIKIDGVFVRDLAEDPTDQALVSSIRQIGHALGMRVVAEHVESEDVRAWLIADGVDYGQGTLIGAPRPVS